MDVTFNNVLEGTRQYFLGLPKQAQAEGSGQPVWPADVSPPEEGAPAQSGAPAPSSRPPSAAAAPPSTPSTVMAVAVPPRPPSEPLEPEPHIIHKATVMREAAEKRRELPQEDEDETIQTLSPPSHIIRKLPRTLPSPAPAPAAPCPSPARPPSTVSLQSQPIPEQQLENTAPYRTPVHRVPTPTARPPDHYAPSRPPDTYSTPRPPDSYLRYHYDTNHLDGGRNSHGPPIPSPQPALSARQSPQTYARISSSLPQHSGTRLRESMPQSPPTQRYIIPASQPPPPHNDRVPPIHHPQIAQPPQRLDVRSTQSYSPLQTRRDSSPYGRMSSHYERQPTVPTRKYDPQHAYPGYRPTPTTTQAIQNHRIETHHPTSYKQAAIDVMNSHYTTRPPDRAPVNPQLQSHNAIRVPTRGEYPNTSRTVDTRSAYPHPTPSTSTARYASLPQIPAIGQNSTNLQQRTPYRGAPVPKTNYDYSTSSTVQTSPARSTVKSGYPNQQARMTVSVTTLVNQMNQTKQKQDLPIAVTASANVVNSPKHKRESPLDLSVKTVKNSADSSTTQDESIDSASLENKTISLQSRPPSSSSRLNIPPTASYLSSHKVDFAPNFIQYRDRNIQHCNVAATAQNSNSIRFNGSYEPRRPSESYHAESQHHTYPERNKYTNMSGRSDCVSRVDLTRPVSDQRLETRRDDRSYVDERKRLAGPINSNIPEKIVRYETWTSDSRMNQFAKEQHDLISRPVYSYSSHKQFEAYQNEQKRPGSSISYREHHSQLNHNHRYSSNHYPSELVNREQNENRGQYHDRSVSNTNRHQVIQKLPHHRETQQLDSHNGIPADKRVLSILRNSLETKHTGYVEPVQQPRHIPDLIVIDDVDDSVIEITDLTKESENEAAVKCISQNSHSTPNMSMPKAVDSVIRDSDKKQIGNLDLKSKSPENDVASRIRTKAELKVMPPAHENTIDSDAINDENIDKVKVQPKSQKQHLFNQIREDERLESVIKNEKSIQSIIPEVKSEPMNIDEIEKDAEVSIKNDGLIKNLELDNTDSVCVGVDDDLDWASACDSFMEQLKDGCNKKKNRKQMETTVSENDKNIDMNTGDANTNVDIIEESCKVDTISSIIIKQEPVDDEEPKQDSVLLENILTEPNTIGNAVQPEKNQEKGKMESTSKTENQNKTDPKQQKAISKKGCKDNAKCFKKKTKSKAKSDRLNNELTLQTAIKKENEECEPPLTTNIKEELESTDDDEPLIKSKLLKEKERSKQLKYQLLKDLSEKSAYVKLECCDVDVNKNSRKSIECSIVDKDEKEYKTKSNKHISKSKGKSNNELTKFHKNNEVSSSESEEDEHTVASRLRLRKNIKNDDNKQSPQTKSPVKVSSKKQELISQMNTGSLSTPIRKPGFGDGSDFRPGWEEELYKYKRSLRMPTRLIAIPRGRSGGPFTKGSGALFLRGSTSLPDLDPAPLSPAPSSAPSAAFDDFYTRRQDKVTLDSDLESNSSYTAPNKLQYDSEASNSTVLSSSKKRNSIIDVLIQKCGRKDESKKKNKDRDDKTPKVIPKSSNTTELLATPSLGLIKTGDKGSLSAKKEKLMEDIFYLGAFRKETVTAFRNAFIKNTDGLIGATEEFAPVVLKSRTRTESRVLKQRATMKEVFGEERPASAPPTSCRDDETTVLEVEPIVKMQPKEPKEPENKPKLKPKKIIKDLKLKRRSSSIRDGLRSTKSLKRNDAKGRLLRLKKRNSIMKSLSNKRLKDTAAKHKKENSPTTEAKVKDEGSSPDAATTGVNVKRRLKRLFGRRKFSSGFDYIRKKKKIVRKDDNNVNKNRRITTKPSPESIHDIHKEMKGWFINKSIGETHLHRAARLGYTDCVAYCLEKMDADPSAKDNAGFTPLHVAAAKGHVRIARLLLEYGANVSAAAQGGIRPLHEASENCHVEIIRLLLAYGADPLLVTYSGQTPEELADGSAAKLIRLHISDIQGLAIEPWRFHHPAEIIDQEESGCDPLSSPPPASPPPPPDSTIEIQCAEAPLPPFYTLRAVAGQPTDGLWCLLQDITNLLQIKSKDSLLKQIHCGSGSPRELFREIRTQEFLERAQCHQLLCAGEKVNVRASKVALVRVTDKLRQLLKVETVLVS